MFVTDWTKYVKKCEDASCRGEQLIVLSDIRLQDVSMITGTRCRAAQGCKMRQGEQVVVSSGTRLHDVPRCMGCVGRYRGMRGMCRAAWPLCRGAHIFINSFLCKTISYLI